MVILHRVMHCGIIILYKQSNSTLHRSKSIVMANEKRFSSNITEGFFEELQNKINPEDELMFLYRLHEEEHITKKTKFSC